jgi:DNA-directed RNA polymerase III subunit RPC8
MFYLVSLRSRLHVPPADFAISFEHSLINEIHAKFANKVLPDVGLLISFHSFLAFTEDVDKGDCSVSSVNLHPIDGGIHLTAEFLMIAFRPEPGEILTGEILASDASGILISTDFFDHFFIPPFELPHPSVFQPQERPPVWVWSFDGQPLYIDVKQQVRFRVLEVKYASNDDEIQENSPENEQNQIQTGEEKKSHESATVNPTAASQIKKEINVSLNMIQSAMKVVCSIKEDGLGLLDWWKE